MTTDLNQTTKTRETTLCERCRYHEIGGKSRLLVVVKLNLLKKTPKKTKQKNSTTISIMQNQQVINLVSKLTVLCSNVLNIFNIAFQHSALNLF